MEADNSKWRVANRRKHLKIRQRNGQGEKRVMAAILKLKSIATTSTVLSCLIYLFAVLLLCSGIEPNPGPIHLRSGNEIESTKTCGGHRNSSQQSRLELSEAGLTIIAADDGAKGDNTSFTDSSEVLQAISKLSQKIDSQYGNIKTEIEEIRSVVCTKLSNLEAEVKCLKVENTELKKKVYNIERNAKVNNLLFFNVQEKERESWQECENLVRSYINDVLKIESDSELVLPIEKVMRLGRKKPGYNRPVCVKFSRQRHRFEILSTFRKHKRENADQYSKKESIVIKEDFPEDVRKIRSGLYGYLTKAVEKLGDKEKVFMKDDILVIGNRTFTFNLQEKSIVPTDKGCLLDWMENADGVL